MAPRRVFWPATLAFSAILEAITLAFRFCGNVSATEFNKTAPLGLQIHHMFWGVPLALAALALRRRPSAPWIGAAALALVASDLAHHFIVLPWVVGNTGWHWP